MKRGLDWYRREPQAIRMAIKAGGGAVDSHGQRIPMTTAQAAVYSLVIDLIYENGGEFPNNPGDISSHFADMGKAKARAVIAELVDMGKLSIRDGMLHQKRAENEAQTRRNLSETRSEAGRLGGVNSGISRRKAKEINDKSEANASTKPEAEREGEREGSGGGSAREANDYDAILLALGLDATRMEPKWLSSENQHTVAQWRALPLSQEEILDELSTVMRGRTGPPSTLAYFTKAMQRRAGLKAAPPLTPIAPHEPQGGTTHGRRHEAAGSTRTQRVIDGAVAAARARRAGVVSW